MIIALLEKLFAKVLPKKATGRPSATPARTGNLPLMSITNQRVWVVNVEGRGRRMTIYESTLGNHCVMRSSWMMFMQPIPMRHTQLFSCLLLLATREWPHSGSRLTPGPVEMSYHCTSSKTSILIASTKQVTELASMQATPSSLPTMVPAYPSSDQSMDQSPGSPAPLVHKPIRKTVGMWKTPSVLPSFGSHPVKGKKSSR